MFNNMFSAIVLVLGSTCLPNETIIHGQYLENSTFRELTHSTIYSCAAACYGYAICKSFNFDKEKKTCFLNSANEIITQDLMKKNPCFLYSNIRLWPESIAGPCKGHICPERCTVTRNKTAKCESGQASHVTSDMTTQESGSQQSTQSGQASHVTSDMTTQESGSQQSTHITPSHAAVYEPVFKDEKVSWQDAVSKCSDKHGSLFIVNTTERSDMIKELLKQKAKNYRVWVGASYDDQSSRWMWEDGQEMVYPTQVLLEGNQDCLSVKYRSDDKPLHWHKKKCTDKLNFLCEV